MGVGDKLNIHDEVNFARIEAKSLKGGTLKDIVKSEIQLWEQSDKRENMIIGDKYYKGKMDIDNKKREKIGEGGRLEEDKLVSNQKLKHLFVKKLVRQKVGYLLSTKLEHKTDNDKYGEILGTIFDNNFHKLLKNTMTNSINSGIYWLYPYIENNKLKFQRMNPVEIIPLWQDNEHTRLDGVIRVYEQEEYQGIEVKRVKRVEFYSVEGIQRWILDGDTLIDDIDMIEKLGNSHIQAISEDGTVEGINWTKVPFIYFKYNDNEQPLIEMIKSLIDDYNLQRSLNSDMLLDTPNEIMHVRNYDGVDPGEFRKNLAAYRTAFTSDDGDVSNITIDINTTAYESHIKTTRKDIFEFGGGVDTNTDKFGNSPSGIALEILYQDLDLDCNDIETEFQASLEYLMYFIDTYIADVLGEGEYFDEIVEFEFTRNKLNNESEIIKDLALSKQWNILSTETIVKTHPLGSENELELYEEEIENTLQDEMDEYIKNMNTKGVDVIEGED